MCKKIAHKADSHVYEMLFELSKLNSSALIYPATVPFNGFKSDTLAYSFGYFLNEPDLRKVYFAYLLSPKATELAIADAITDAETVSWDFSIIERLSFEQCNFFMQKYAPIRDVCTVIKTVVDRNAHIESRFKQQFIVEYMNYFHRCYKLVSHAYFPIGPSKIRAMDSEFEKMKKLLSSVVGAGSLLECQSFVRQMEEIEQKMREIRAEAISSTVYALKDLIEDLAPQEGIGHERIDRELKENEKMPFGPVSLAGDQALFLDCEQEHWQDDGSNPMRREEIKMRALGVATLQIYEKLPNMVSANNNYMHSYQIRFLVQLYRSILATKIDEIFNRPVKNSDLCKAYKNDCYFLMLKLALRMFRLMITILIADEKLATLFTNEETHTNYKTLSRRDIIKEIKLRMHNMYELSAQFPPTESYHELASLKALDFDSIGEFVATIYSAYGVARNNIMPFEPDTAEKVYLNPKLQEAFAKVLVDLKNTVSPFMNAYYILFHKHII